MLVILVVAVPLFRCNIERFIEMNNEWTNRKFVEKRTFDCILEDGVLITKKHCEKEKEKLQMLEAEFEFLNETFSENDNG